MMERHGSVIAGGTLPRVLVEKGIKITELSAVSDRTRVHFEEGQIISAQLRELFGPISAFPLSNLVSLDVNAMEIETVVQRSPKVSVLSTVGEVGAEPTSGPGVSSVHINNVRPGLQRQTGF